mgnify:CR=1 FL=1|tara:strand:- start:31229 stop:32071 length:843 start_codon:yes stop_codon:yes gene_type:complete
MSLEDQDIPPSKIKTFLKKFLFFKPKSVNDVSEVLEHALSENIIDKEAQLIAEKAIRLGDTTVKEIMVPKIEMVTITINEDLNEILARIIKTGHSRYPVLGEDKNDVLGLLLAKDLLPILQEDNKKSIKDMLRDAKIIPENKKADSLLEDFKEDRSHMAVVIDEYGSISGLVTIEDVLEELVGEIEDEHDLEETDELIQVSDSEYIADAMLDINVFSKKFNRNFKDSDIETLGGLFIQKIGHLPKVGDRIQLGNLNLTVTAADKRKVKKIGITVQSHSKE